MSHLMVDRKPILIGTVGTVGLLILVLSLTGTKPQTAEAQSPSASRVRDVLPRGALDDAGDQLARIASHVKTAVVHIESRRDGRSGGTVEETGSGVLMRSARTSKMFVVTNRHVIQGSTPRRIQIKLQDGQIINPEQVIEDAPTDVAVLLLAETNLGSAAWGDSDNLDIGHMVLAMGSPFGLSQSVTLGIISAKGRRSLILGEKGQDVINQDFLQTDAAINPGNSGGPLIDLQGRVIGINTAIASQGGGNEGIGFSIPSNLCRHVVEQLLEHGRVQRAFLGVRLDEEFDAAAAKRLRLNRLHGARVVEVYGDTPAEVAGLQIDDVVLAFDGQEIEDQSHLIHLVSLTPVNKVVRMSVLRAASRITVDVRLTERRPTQTSQKEETAPFKMNSFSEKKARQSGLTVVRLDDSLAVQVGNRVGTRGVLVTQCDNTENADALQLYDIIEEAARQTVTEPTDLDQILSENAGPVLLKVRRTIEGQLQSRLILWSPPAARTSD
jgi:serine protease Do